MARSLLVAAAAVLALLVLGADLGEAGKSPAPPPISLKAPRTQAPPPTARPPPPPRNPQQDGQLREMASSPCLGEIQALQNLTMTCLGNVSAVPNNPDTMSPSLKADVEAWCAGKSGCRSILQSQLASVMRACNNDHDNGQGSKDKGVLIPGLPMQVVANLTRAINDNAAMLCRPPAPPVTCDDDVPFLKTIGGQGPPPVELLDAACTPCALESATRRQRATTNLTEKLELALAKSSCDLVDGQYCGPRLGAFAGADFAGICSPCSKKKYAKVAFVNGDDAKQDIFRGVCLQNSTGGLCAPTLLRAMNVSLESLAASMLPNATARLAIPALAACNNATMCAPGCQASLQAVVGAAGCCSSAIPALMRFLRQDTVRPCMEMGLAVSPPCLAPTRFVNRFRINSTDPPDVNCQNLKLDLGASLGVDPMSINCTYAPIVAPQSTLPPKIQQLLVQVATPVSSDYTFETSTDAVVATGSTTLSFESDMVSGPLIVLDVPATTTMAPASAGPLSGSDNTTTTSTSAAPTPSTASTKSASTPAPTTSSATSSAALGVASAIAVLAALAVRH